MSDDKTGGPAFPHEPSQYGIDGMTLRDYFAGQALAGMLAGYFGNDEMSGVSPEAFAKESYWSADAMIKGRNK